MNFIPIRGDDPSYYYIGVVIPVNRRSLGWNVTECKNVGALLLKRVQQICTCAPTLLHHRVFQDIPRFLSNLDREMLTRYIPPVNSHPQEDLQVTTAQAARYLGLSTATVVRWANLGRIPHARSAAGHRRFRLGDLDKVLTTGGITNVDPALAPREEAASG